MNDDGVFKWRCSFTSTQVKFFAKLALIRFFMKISKITEIKSIFSSTVSFSFSWSLLFFHVCLVIVFHFYPSVQFFSPFGKSKILFDILKHKKKSLRKRYINKVSKTRRFLLSLPEFIQRKLLSLLKHPFLAKNSINSKPLPYRPRKRREKPANNKKWAWWEICYPFDEISRDALKRGREKKEHC